MREIRKKLIELMETQQMNLSEFAEKCGIEENRIQKILYERGRLTTFEAHKIADAFGTTVEGLFDVRLFDVRPLSDMEERKRESVEFYQKITERLNVIAQINKADADKFAEVCGFSRNRAVSLLKGKGILTIPEAVSVVKCFNVSMDYIMGIYPYPLPTPQDEDDARLYALIGKMSVDELTELAERLRKDLNGETS